jgi:hypothetical protein
VAGQQIKLFDDATTNVALPGPGVHKTQVGHDGDPIQGTTDAQGNAVLRAGDDVLSFQPGLALDLDVTAQSSLNLQFGAGNDVVSVAQGLPPGLRPFVTDALKLDGSTFITLTYPTAMGDTVAGLVRHIRNLVGSEINFCREKQSDVIGGEGR